MQRKYGCDILPFPVVGGDAGAAFLAGVCDHLVNDPQALGLGLSLRRIGGSRFGISDTVKPITDSAKTQSALTRSDPQSALTATDTPLASDASRKLEQRPAERIRRPDELLLANRLGRGTAVGSPAVQSPAIVLAVGQHMRPQWICRLTSISKAVVDHVVHMEIARFL